MAVQMFTGKMVAEQDLHGMSPGDLEHLRRRRAAAGGSSWPSTGSARGMRQNPAARSATGREGRLVLELALSLAFLMPLMMSVFDYGYYFYVGTNAEDAGAGRAPSGRQGRRGALLAARW